MQQFGFRFTGYLLGLTLILLGCNNNAGTIKRAEVNTGTFYETVQNHKQVYPMTCIPSSIEMILKYYKKVDPDFYQLQDDLSRIPPGTFHDYDNRIISGIAFKHYFAEPRGDNFPLEELYQTIATELKAGRKVIISLASGPNLYHIYVVDQQTSNGDFVAYSRDYNLSSVLEVRNVKDIVKGMQGTDILTYQVAGL